MPSLLLVVFVLQLVIHLVNTVGAGTVNSLLWLLYSKLGTPTAASARSQVELRREVVRLKREMDATSSQDEFARWAKLRRQHDKELAEYERVSQSLSAFKHTFDRNVGVVRWLGTTGLRFFLQVWYAKQPVYWLPRGWLPGYVEWLLACPRAPTGSISIQMWGAACIVVVRLVSAALVAGWAFVMQMQARAQQSGSKSGPMKMGAGGEGGSGKEL